MNPVWCEPYIRINQKIVCGNWNCTCGKKAKQHCSGNCGCGLCPDLSKNKTFTYDNNDSCTLECQFYRKLYEMEMV